MDLVIEFLMELLFEGAMEVSKNRKVSNWIRYPLIIFIVLLFGFVIFGIFILGIASRKENLLLSILLIALSIFLLVACILKFKKVYLEKKKDINIGEGD